MAYRHVLNDDEKRELLRIARATLREHLRTRTIPPGKPHHPAMLDPAGAFVTLRTREGHLRGCIGTQDESVPLFQTIQEMAVAAASRDPRFEPVTTDELDNLVIEISVLGDRAEVRGPDDVRVGLHGLVIECAGRRGLLLPQVATEQRWDAETFLDRVCVKAGLPPDAWRRPEARVERFTAQVFDEAELPSENMLN